MIKRKGLILTLIFSFWLGISFAENLYAIYGDSRSGHEVHQRIVDEIAKMKPQAVFHTGDLVNKGEDPGDWLMFDRITSKLREGSEMYPALGNHDLPPGLFFEEFPLLGNRSWYSVKGENADFIVLDTTSGLKPGSEQYKWLKAELAAAEKRKKFIIVTTHHPVFSIGSHYQESAPFRAILCPLFEKYRVSIVFSGHDHNYQRSLYRDVFYIVSGGGGAPLYDKVTSSPYNQVFNKAFHFCRLAVEKNKLVLTVFDLEGAIIDQVQITRM